MHPWSYIKMVCFIYVWRLSDASVFVNQFTLFLNKFFNFNLISATITLRLQKEGVYYLYLDYNCNMVIWKPINQPSGGKTRRFNTANT
jgi:hypothetical protein